MRRLIWLMLPVMLLALLAPACAEEGIRLMPRDAYQEGMDAFTETSYAEAAELFEAAGNHEDAAQWAYYCQAIDLIVNGEGTLNEIQRAQARFELLEVQNFRQADQWVDYCQARIYELRGTPSRARELYGGILVYNSVQRYLTCVGKPDLLESEEELIARLDAADRFLMGEAAYEVAVAFYESKDYEDASAYFCLAGNYEDALQWRCYCQAIVLITEHDLVEDAQTLFNLLELQGFELARDWGIYCQARGYESDGVNGRAIDEYKKILVHDSGERYLDLLNLE